jgi:hypothetical protein
LRMQAQQESSPLRRQPRQAIDRFAVPVIRASGWPTLAAKTQARRGWGSRVYCRFEVHCFPTLRKSAKGGAPSRRRASGCIGQRRARRLRLHRNQNRNLRARAIYDGNHRLTVGG